MGEFPSWPGPRPLNYRAARTLVIARGEGQTERGPRYPLQWDLELGRSSADGVHVCVALSADDDPLTVFNPPADRWGRHLRVDGRPVHALKRAEIGERLHQPRPPMSLADVLEITDGTLKLIQVTRPRAVPLVLQLLLRTYADLGEVMVTTLQPRVAAMASKARIRTGLLIGEASSPMALLSNLAPARALTLAQADYAVVPGLGALSRCGPRAAIGWAEDDQDQLLRYFEHPHVAAVTTTKPSLAFDVRTSAARRGR
jgi:hypothetical protein